MRKTRRLAASRPNGPPARPASARSHRRRPSAARTTPRRRLAIRPNIAVGGVKSLGDRPHPRDRAAAEDASLRPIALADRNASINGSGTTRYQPLAIRRHMAAQRQWTAIAAGTMAAAGRGATRPAALSLAAAVSPVSAATSPHPYRTDPRKLRPSKGLSTIKAGGGDRLLIAGQAVGTTGP